MSDNELHEIFITAQGYYQKNGYDLNEANGTNEKKREDQWHHCLALAVDDLNLTAFRKLHMFSVCIRNLAAEVERLKNNNDEKGEAI